MDATCLFSEMGFASKETQQSHLERWRQAGYAAVDKMIVQLKDQIEGKDAEEISNILKKEGNKQQPLYLST